MPLIRGWSQPPATARDAADIGFTLQQRDADWGGEPTRHEFVIVVRSDVPLAGLPDRLAEPEKRDDLIRPEEIKSLQMNAYEPDTGVRNAETLRILRTGLARAFRTDRFRLEVYVYSSENHLPNPTR